MKIRNAVIITDTGTELRMTVDEQNDFTGNIIFSRDKLPASLATELYRAVGKSTNKKSATPDHRRASVNAKVVA